MGDTSGFREECRAWLRANCPPSMRWPERAVGNPTLADDLAWGGRKESYPNPEVRQWLDAMAERGWTAPTWPTQYGGGGLDVGEAKVLREEMNRLRAKPPLVGFGLTMIGPLLLDHGSEELKQRFLPQICHGEIRWCQGYSEPNAGSDLASLQASAVADQGRLTVKVLLPEAHNMRTVGGRGQKAFWVFDDNYDWQWAANETQPRPLNDFEDIPYGEWRLEIEPADTALYHNFLTVLQPAHVSDAPMPPAQAVQTQGEMAGVWIGDPAQNRLLLFSTAQDGAPPPGAVTYSYTPT
ncbi:MAG: acyl-CoA dehydrogenase family protein, partial [Candidatus Binatia bacterium]